jgi:hypothetical protein
MNIRILVIIEISGHRKRSGPMQSEEYDAKTHGGGRQIVNLPRQSGSTWNNCETR